MNATDQLAADRILKVRAELILAHTFYGVLVSQVEPVPSRKFPTMATNGKQHFYNPDFIAGLTPDEVLGVQRHESEHDARRHHTRRGGRDPQEWNICCDYAINIDLVDEGVTLPKGALVDPKYRGMSAEDIYRCRELDRQQQQQPPQPQEGDGEADEGQDGQQDGDDQGDDGQEQDGEAQDGDQPGDEGQEGDEAGDDEAQADGQGDDGEPGDDEGQGQGDEAQDGDQGQGQGEGQGEPGEAGEGEGQGDGDATQEGAQAGGKGGDSCGDPGQCGEVLDAADDAAELTEADSKWETVLRQAASLAAKRGDAPGHVTREIRRADMPKQDWREVLRAWIDTGATTIETWSRPNRRFAGGGLYLPGRQRDGLNRVVFAIDTSGSMDELALRCVATEAQAALDDGAIDEVIAVYGDTRVTRVDTYAKGDEIVFDPRGGGGTDLKPLFQYVADEVDNASLIVCFTDMEIGDPGPEPSCPVLFAATGYPDRVAEYLANAPWGAPGIDVGAH